jgi:hypothetical protein
MVGQAIPMEMQGETFSHVFGTNTSLFEQFVLCRNIMGPTWLKIKNPKFGIVTNVGCLLVVGSSIALTVIGIMV